jgi:hypothetical protein
MAGGGHIQSTNFPLTPSKRSSRTTADLHQPPFRATAAVCHHTRAPGGPERPKPDHFGVGFHASQTRMPWGTYSGLVLE